MNIFQSNALGKIRVEMRPHLIGVRAVYYQEPAVVQTIENRIVVRTALRVAKDVVARLHRLHRFDRVDRQRLGPGRNVGSLEHELRHVRKIEQSGAMTNRVVLFEDTGILHRHFETGKRHETCAMFAVLVVERRAT